MKGTWLPISSLMRLNTKSHRFASMGMIISCMFPFIFTAWWLVAIICIYEVAYTSGTPDECLRCGTISLSPVDTPARHTSTTGCSVSLLPAYTLAAYAKVSELCNHITSRSTVLIRNDCIFAPPSTCMINGQVNFDFAVLSVRKHRAYINTMAKFWVVPPGKAVNTWAHLIFCTY